MCNEEPRRIKYVITRSGYPIVFSPLLDHSAVASGIPILSAGMCEIWATEAGKIDGTCFGKSTTLDKVSDPGDWLIVHRMLVQNGI